MCNDFLIKNHLISCSISDNLPHKDLWVGDLNRGNVSCFNGSKPRFDELNNAFKASMDRADFLIKDLNRWLDEAKKTLMETEIVSSTNKLNSNECFFSCQSQCQGIAASNSSSSVSTNASCDGLFKVTMNIRSRLEEIRCAWEYYCLLAVNGGLAFPVYLAWYLSDLSYSYQKIKASSGECLSTLALCIKMSHSPSQLPQCPTSVMDVGTDQILDDKGSNPPTSTSGATRFTMLGVVAITDLLLSPIVAAVCIKWLSVSIPIALGVITPGAFIGVLAAAFLLYGAYRYVNNQRHRLDLSGSDTSLFRQLSDPCLEKKADNADRLGCRYSLA